MTRRGFLGALVSAAVLPAVAQLEPFLATLYVPDATIVTATTLQDAVAQALCIKWPDGWTQNILSELDRYHGGYLAFLRDVQRQGGRVIATRGWRVHEVAA